MHEIQSVLLLKQIKEDKCIHQQYFCKNKLTTNNNFNLRFEFSVSNFKFARVPIRLF